MRIKLSVLFRLLQYVAVATATFFVTSFSLSVQNSPGVKAPSHALIIAFAIIIGLGGVADGVYRTLSEATGNTSFDRRLLVEDNLKALLVSLAEETTIPWTEIGLTAFVVRWTLRHPFRRVQIRVARLRMKSTPRPTAILWTKKKGVLGRCWRNLQDEDVDHQAKHGSYRNYTRDQWEALGQDVREHLSFDDFLAIRDFGYILASPIFDRKSRYRGCLCIQVAPGFQSQLAAGSASRDLLHLSAYTIAAVLFGA